MKNICLITQCSLPIPTTKGGAVETLVEYILEENEKCGKYHFTVISVADEKARQLSEKYKYTNFIYIEESNKRLNYFLLQAYRVLKHMNIYIPFSFEFRKALKILRTIENQDLFIFEAGPTTQLPALHKIIPKEKLAVHLHWDGMGNVRKDECFSYLIPISDYIGNCWQKATQCSKDKIRPLYNCAKLERFTQECTEKEKQDLREKLGIPQKNKVIIYTGRIVQDKGVRELLLAYEQLNTPDTTLMIIGSANFGAKTNTPYEKEIETIIENSKKSVVFTGYVHQTKLYQYYAIADISVMPSLFQEPAGLVCIEAQATGTPIIATRVGGLPEYTNEDCTVLVEKDDNLVNTLTKEIDSLLNDEEKQKQMQDKERKNAMRFTTEVYFSEFSALIDEMIKENENHG